MADQRGMRAPPRQRRPGTAKRQREQRGKRTGEQIPPRTVEARRVLERCSVLAAVRSNFRPSSHALALDRPPGKRGLLANQCA
jgi:hypothetical protein